jgi:hypothetical protein
MEGLDIDRICRIPQLSKPDIRKLLKAESTELEVTVSLLNLLHNIVRVGSVSVSRTQKDFLDKNSALVLQLLSKNRSISWKKSQLETNIPLVITIAGSCPTIAGS